MSSTNDRRFHRMAKLAGTGIAALALVALVTVGRRRPISPKQQ